MQLITSNKSLKEFCKFIKEEDSGGFITVDTEFMREDTYWSELCLIQIAGSKRNAIIDPLSQNIDLEILKQLFFDIDIVKVFHSARQDLEIFYNLWEDLPKPLFDTQIAAMACGFGESISYSNLVEKYTKNIIDKSSRFTNWKRRPLSEKQLLYAINDVTYLRTIYENLISTLKKLDRVSWIDEEMDILLDPKIYQEDADKLWIRLKPKVKSRKFLARLKAVAVTRDKIARRKNIPRPRVIRDQILLEMPSISDLSLDEFDKLRGISSSFSKSDVAKEFLESIKQVENIPIDQYPKLPKKSSKAKSLEPIIDLLRVYLKQVILKHNVAGKMIASSEDLY